jgi:hypothetical protein
VVRRPGTSFKHNWSIAMPLLYFGFLSVALLWLFFALVWAAALLFWPITLLIAAWVLWRGRGRWSSGEAGGRPERMQRPVRRDAGRNEAFRNEAFEGYREETLHRLDEEQGKFRDFLERLRRSRDKQEFDAYMAARRARPAVEGPHGSTSPA